MNQIIDYYLFSNSLDKLKVLYSETASEERMLQVVGEICVSFKDVEYIKNGILNEDLDSLTIILEDVETIRKNITSLKDDNVYFRSLIDVCEKKEREIEYLMRELASY
jgi:hypothetical protein